MHDNTHTSTEPQMPEHNLEPPKFSRKALERILNDWTAVKSMLLTGVKEAPHGCVVMVILMMKVVLKIGVMRVVVGVRTKGVMMIEGEVVATLTMVKLGFSVILVFV